MFGVTARLDIVAALSGLGSFNVPARLGIPAALSAPGTFAAPYFLFGRAVRDLPRESICNDRPVLLE